MGFEDAVVILALVNFIFLFANWRLQFKIAYYEQKLDNRGIKDNVRTMPWWKLWIN